MRVKCRVLCILEVARMRAYQLALRLTFASNFLGFGVWRLGLLGLLLIISASVIKPAAIAMAFVTGKLGCVVLGGT